VFIAVTALALHGCTDTGDADANLKPTTRKERKNKRKVRRDETEESEEDEVSGGKDQSALAAEASAPPVAVPVKTGTERALTPGLSESDDEESFVFGDIYDNEESFGFEDISSPTFMSGRREASKVISAQDSLKCGVRSKMRSFFSPSPNLEVGLCDNDYGFESSDHCTLMMELSMGTFRSIGVLPATAVFKHVFVSSSAAEQAGCIKPNSREFAAYMHDTNPLVEEMVWNNKQWLQISCTGVDNRILAVLRTDTVDIDDLRIQKNGKELGTDYCAAMMARRQLIIDKTWNMVPAGIHTRRGYLVADTRSESDTKLRDMVANVVGCTYRFFDIDTEVLTEYFDYPKKGTGVRKARFLIGCLHEEDFTKQLKIEPKRQYITKKARSKETTRVTCMEENSSQKPYGEYVFASDIVEHPSTLCARLHAARLFFLEKRDQFESSEASKVRRVILAELRRAPRERSFISRNAGKIWNSFGRNLDRVNAYINNYNKGTKMQ